MGRIEEIMAQREAEESFNASDPKSVSDRTKKLARREAGKSRITEQLLSTAAGRRWLMDIIVFCDPLGNPHVPNSSDATAFNIGLANVGRMVLSKILDVDPARYGHMLNEYQKEVLESKEE